MADDKKETLPKNDPGSSHLPYHTAATEKIAVDRAKKLDKPTT